jgi:hypothetical protein
MSEPTDSLERYHDAIKEILLREWDPIGIGGFAGAQDEYDGYVDEINELLNQHPSADRIFDWLWSIETEHMMLDGNRQQTLRVAERLAGLAT